MRYDERTGIKTVEAGDQISALGKTYTVSKVLSQEHFPESGRIAEWWHVEFLDERNSYHHWKNEFDGGRIIPKSE